MQHTQKIIANREMDEVPIIIEEAELVTNSSLDESHREINVERKIIGNTLKSPEITINSNPLNKIEMKTIEKVKNPLKKSKIIEIPFLLDELVVTFDFQLKPILEMTTITTDKQLTPINTSSGTLTNLVIRTTIEAKLNQTNTEQIERSKSFRFCFFLSI